MENRNWGYILQLDNNGRAKQSEIWLLEVPMQHLWGTFNLDNIQDHIGVIRRIYVLQQNDIQTLIVLQSYESC